jgi:hypothetical protein
MNNKKIASIHQPDFMPWLGLFNKIARSDIFVVLDHVLNNPNDGSWFRRVRVIAGGQPHWITIPLVKPKDSVFVPINKMQIKIEDKKFVKKNLQTIYQNYSRTKYFKDVIYLIDDYFQDEEVLMGVRNMKFINKVCSKLNITTQFIYSSALNCEKKATELLVEICNKVGANVYLCGGGADGYQQDDLFAESNIKLIYNKFQHPVYDQANTNEFIPGLSIIDPLMNCGFEGVKQMLHSISKSEVASI